MSAIDDVKAELERARAAFPETERNAHEGYAILAEEVDELWDAVKLNQKNPDRKRRLRAEAVQVAAMAIRFIEDVCDAPEEKQPPIDTTCPFCGDSKCTWGCRT